MTDMRPLRVLIIEDEALIAMDLEQVLLELGHTVVGIATTKAEAIGMALSEKPELALVDIHLDDGPTGIEAATLIASMGVRIVFTSANMARVPENYRDSLGAIGKPYSENGMRAALYYIAKGMRDPPPDFPTPPSLRLSDQYRLLWA
jgi:AmiR/NasT family two-component response regulator